MMLEKLMTKDRWDSLMTYSVIWLTALITFVGWVTGQTLPTFAVLAVESEMKEVCQVFFFFLFYSEFFLFYSERNA